MSDDQPALGKAADAWGYGPSFVISGVLHAVALPFLLLAARERASSDRWHTDDSV